MRFPVQPSLLLVAGLSSACFSPADPATATSASSTTASSTETSTTDPSPQSSSTAGPDDGSTAGNSDTGLSTTAAEASTSLGVTTASEASTSSNTAEDTGANTDTDPVDRLPTSCLDALNDDPNAPDGSYLLDIDGDGPASPLELYCDMSTDGGGWTLVVGIAASNSDHNTSAEVAPEELSEFSGLGKLSDHTINTLVTQVFRLQVDTEADCEDLNESVFFEHDPAIPFAADAVDPGGRGVADTWGDPLVTAGISAGSAQHHGLDPEINGLCDHINACFIYARPDQLGAYDGSTGPCPSSMGWGSSGRLWVK